MMSRSMPQHTSPQGGLGGRGLPQGSPREQGARAYPICVTQSNVLGCQGQCLNTSPLNPNRSVMCLQLATNVLIIVLLWGWRGKSYYKCVTQPNDSDVEVNASTHFTAGGPGGGGGPAGEPLGDKVPEASESSSPPSAPHHRPKKTLRMCICSCYMHSSSASNLELTTDMHL